MSVAVQSFLGFGLIGMVFIATVVNHFLSVQEEARRSK